jgi:excisionase family DNA binding protein
MLMHALRAQEQKQALIVDPLLKLAEVMPLVGSPSYCTLLRWIREGSLRVHRVGRGHYRVRLSEVQRFRTSGEAVQP